MKHLFLVHSFATYRCAMGVIAHERLSLRECIFVTYRGFKCQNAPEEILMGHLPSIGTPNLNSRYRLFPAKKKLHQRDEEVDDLTKGERFHCYTPHTYFDYAHLIVTHPQCCGFSYIEEGLTSYYKWGGIDKAYPPWQFILRVKLLRRWLFKKRLPTQINFFRDGYQKAYGFTDLSFPDWKRKVAIGIDKLYIQPSSRSEIHPPVLIFDALVEWKRTSLSVFCSTLESFLARCVQDRIKELQYKLHPGQDEQGSALAVREVMKKHTDIKTTELDVSVCLEDLFESFNLDVFVFNSAAGLYAALAEQRVYSLNSLLTKEDPAYGEMVNSLPEIYNSLVKPYVVA